MRYSIDPELLRTILPMLAREEDRIVHKSVRSVALRKVLSARPYSETKLERCRKWLEKTISTPAIPMARYWLYNADYYITANDYYLLEDSAHRIAAALEIGSNRITARIHAEYACKPNMYRLDPAQAMLWRQVPDGWQFIKNELTIEQIQALRLVGVGTMVYGPKGLRRDTFGISQ